MTTPVDYSLIPDPDFSFGNSDTIHSMIKQYIIQDTTSTSSNYVNMTDFQEIPVNKKFTKADNGLQYSGNCTQQYTVVNITKLDTETAKLCSLTSDNAISGLNTFFPKVKLKQVKRNL